MLLITEIFNKTNCSIKLVGISYVISRIAHKFTFFVEPTV